MEGELCMTVRGLQNYDKTCMGRKRNTGKYDGLDKFS